MKSNVKMKNIARLGKKMKKKKQKDNKFNKLYTFLADSADVPHKSSRE